jgi:glycosyltransferase involved in cell wall biosynthesis
MARPLKVFHLLADYKWTGPAEGAVTLCRDLINRGHLVRFYCTPHPIKRLAEQAAARAVIPEEALWLDAKHLLKMGWDIFQLGRILKTERPDFLHLHRSEDHLIGALARQWSASPARIVRTIHHPRTLEMKPFRRWLYRSGTDGFITLNRRDSESLQHLYGISSERIRVIHGAVDTSRFHPDHDPRPIRAEFGIPPSAPVIGFVSRFQSHRRHETMVSIMTRLKTMIPSVRLLLVGKGEHLPVIANQVRDLGLQHHVIFAGYRDRDLPQVYAAMNVAVQLACGSEVSCRASLEAMACGLPVVGFPIGSLPETIIDGMTGHLIPEGDSDALVFRLADLLADRTTAQKMSEAARKHVEDHFSETGRLQKTEAFYEVLSS